MSELTTADIATIRYGVRHGSTAKEIASVLGCSIDTVYRHIHIMYRAGELPEREKTMQQHRRYPSDVRLAAMQLMRNGVSVSTVSERLGISTAALYRWRKELPIAD